jgi:hypothetical protein
MAVVALLVSLTFTSCKGPAGTAGIDGKDANETCKQCHNPTMVDAKAVEFELSKHNTGVVAEEEAGNATCAPCHESAGFKYVCANNVSTVFTADPANAGSFLNPYAATSTTAFGAIDCYTCHNALHTTYTSADLSLTTTASVPLTMWGGAKTVNLTQDNSKSNLCVKCHQPRPLTNATTKNVLDYADLAAHPTDAVTTALLKLSYRTGTHYGTVGAVFAGMGGVEFTGTMAYTSSQHTTVASCQDCHMGTMAGAAGGHSFNAKGNFTGCNATGCHTTAFTDAGQMSTYFTTPRADIKTLLDALAAKLVENGVEILGRNGDATANLWYGLTTNNYDGYFNIYDPASNPNGGTYNTAMFKNPSPAGSWTQVQKDYNNTLPALTLTKGQLGAVINFDMCLREYSLGIHNYKYVKALLTNTIAIL